MTSRPRLPLALLLASSGLALAAPGCGETFYTGPLAYSRSESMATDLADKPKLQAAVNKTLNKIFGETPNQIRVPRDSGLPDGGRRLAQTWTYEGKRGRYVTHPTGGYALYRHHCLHCHGLSGDGEGPTAPFLYPRPRDYRRGVFKFTSTTGNKPTRDDLRKTIKYGLHGTSMPAFEAQMSPKEIEQVIDYVTFLSARGETERQLIGEATTSEDKDAESSITDDLANEIATRVFGTWKETETQVLPPNTKRVPSSRASVLRGRELFLGQTKEKLECAGCHGPRAVGNGPSFIKQDVFNAVVFRRKGFEKREQYEEVTIFDAIAAKGDTTKGEEWVAVKDLPPKITPPKGFEHAQPTPIETILERLATKGFIARDKSGGADRVKLRIKPEQIAGLRAERDLWEKSLDDWEVPLRPANLNLGIYKGGRRPIDIYWRIAKGINGAKMPAHLQSFPDHPEEIWNLVNFVLALPYEPELLKDATLAPAAPPAGPAAGPKVASH